jgi:diguanylate cyclase (GGDEF)-like protein
MKNDLSPELLAPVEALELAGLLSQAREAVIHLDKNWVVQYCNDVYLQDTGLSRAQVIGHTPFEFEPQSKRSIFFQTIERCHRERRPTAAIGYSTVLERWLMVRLFPVGEGMLALANDASEAVVKQYQLAQQALRDTLTGLPNKLALVEQMQALADTGQCFTLAMIGISGLSTVNDAVGHAQGDLALMEVASRLQIATGAQEQLFRFGGDEFAVLLPLPEEQARPRVSELSERARMPVVLRSGQVFTFGAAAGMVCSPHHGQEPEQLLKRATLALKKARRQAEHDIEVYEPSLEAAARWRAEIEADLREAVATGQFMLALQPRGAMPGRQVVGAEALIRWPHPVRGNISPDQFLPVAAECGLMRAIDQWVLETALSHIQRLQQRGLALPVSINVSVDALADEGFVDSVRLALRKADVPARLLEIEIPEGSLMKDVDVSARVLAGLNALGVRISVDDFGTGYSSFAYLAHFPVHALKVDRSFVTDMNRNEASLKIVAGLIGLAHSLNLRVIAEGAETDEQIAVLHRLDCDEVQGYGFARPMPFGEFCTFAAAHRQRRGPDPFAI